MTSRRIATAAVLVLLAGGCGSGPPVGGPGTPTAGGTGTEAATDGDAGDGGETAEATPTGESGVSGEQHVLVTELDFGLPFAEDPFFDGLLGPYGLHLNGFRGAGPHIAITLRNDTGTAAEDVRLAVTVEGVPLRNGGEAETATSTTSDAPAIGDVTTSQGDCALDRPSPDDALVTCDLGILAPGEQALVVLDVTRPLAFTLSFDLTTA